MIKTQSSSRPSSGPRARPAGVAVTPNFKAKTECIPLCVLGLTFTHKMTNSEINSISSVYYIDYCYRAYCKTKRSKQRNKPPHHKQMTGGPHA
jgi:hypothetical protein